MRDLSDISRNAMNIRFVNIFHVRIVHREGLVHVFDEILTRCINSSRSGGSLWMVTVVCVGRVVPGDLAVRCQAGSLPVALAGALEAEDRPCADYCCQNADSIVCRQPKSAQGRIRDRPACPGRPGPASFRPGALDAPAPCIIVSLPSQKYETAPFFAITRLPQGERGRARTPWAPNACRSLRGAAGARLANPAAASGAAGARCSARRTHSRPAGGTARR